MPRHFSRGIQYRAGAIPVITSTAEVTAICRDHYPGFFCGGGGSAGTPGSTHQISSSLYPRDGNNGNFRTTL